MRIIPRNTKVQVELFKGIGIGDIFVAVVGAAFLAAVLVSNISIKLPLALIIIVLTVTLLVPFDNEKVYVAIYHLINYLSRYKKYMRLRYGRSKSAVERTRAESGSKKKIARQDVSDITPFKSIKDEFINYGDYFGIVLEVPSVEFRFMTDYRQNQIIDKVLGAVLRTVSGDEMASFVKIDRPIIYDDFITEEHNKIESLKQAYINGMLSENEIASRLTIIYDRIETIKNYNKKNKVYKPFYYLVFFGSDRVVLKNKALNAVQTMAGSGMNCKILDEKQLAVFLKYNYTNLFDEREIDNIPREKYMDWILPESIEFAARTVKYDNIITHNLRVADYPRLVSNAWGAQLFNQMGTRVVMKMKPIENYKAVRRIDRAIDELRVQYDETGKSSKIIELNTHIDTLSELLFLLKNDNETLFDVNTYVTIYDYELSERMLRPKAKQNVGAPLTSFKKQIKRILAEDGFRTNDMFSMQHEAYASSHISKHDSFSKQSRGIHSSSVAATFPFVYLTLSDLGGINIGKNGVIPVFIDFFKRDTERVNSNLVVIGKSGGGKSFATKTILTNLAAENTKVFILDPENEYSGIAKKMNGKIIDVGSATQGRLNPFHVITTASDDEDADDDDAVHTSLNTHLQFLEEFFRQILKGINNDALEYLNNMLIDLYKSKGIDSETDFSKLKPKDYPIFDDLYKMIKNEYEKARSDYSKNNLRILMNYISKFAEGGRNSHLWNGEATITTNENFIVFNFQSLLANKNNVIANAQMLLVLKWLDNEIIKNRDYNLKYNGNRRIIVAIDEAHVFIDPKFPVALDFMYQLAKRIRKYNGMQIIITQNIKDFTGTEEIARKSTAIISASQYSFIFPLSPGDMNDLCLLYEKSGAINESEQEEIVNNGRGRAFVITSPQNRTSINIVASEEMQKMF